LTTWWDRRLAGLVGEPGGVRAPCAGPERRAASRASTTTCNPRAAAAAISACSCRRATEWSGIARGCAANPYPDPAARQPASRSRAPTRPACAPSHPDPLVCRTADVHVGRRRTSRAFPIAGALRAVGARQRAPSAVQALACRPFPRGGDRLGARGLDRLRSSSAPQLALVAARSRMAPGGRRPDAARPTLGEKSRRLARCRHSAIGNDTGPIHLIAAAGLSAPSCCSRAPRPPCARRLQAGHGWRRLPISPTCPRTRCLALVLTGAVMRQGRPAVSLRRPTEDPPIH